MPDCKHLNFYASVDVVRITDDGTDNGNVQCYYADIRIHCTDCKEQFTFIGLPCGLSPTEPMVSVDGAECRMPIKPSSQDDSTFLAAIAKMPGFTIKGN